VKSLLCLVVSSAAVLTMIVSQTAQATTMPRLEISELWENAAAVVLVQVMEGRLLCDGDCGAIYTGRVVERFKGLPKSTIQFGHQGGFAIGAQYLLFLTDPGKTYSPLMSDNSISARLRAEAIEECRMFWRGFEIMHSGLAYLEIADHFSIDESGEDVVWIRVAVARERWVQFPESIPRIPLAFRWNEQRGEPAAMPLDEVMRVLRRMD